MQRLDVTYRDLTLLTLPTPIGLLDRFIRAPVGSINSRVTRMERDPLTGDVRIYWEAIYPMGQLSMGF